MRWYSRWTRPRAMLLALGLALSAGSLYATRQNSSVNLANPTTDTTSTMALTYSPNALSQTSGIITVNNGTKSADNVAYCMTFTLSNPGQQGGMSFRLVNSGTGNILSLSGSPTDSTQVISGSFASGTAANTNVIYSIAFQLDPSPLPAPGTYTATILEKLYRGSTFPPAGSPVDTNTLTITITVGSFYDLSVVPSGSFFSVGTTSQALNFGTLAAGAKLGADIVIRSNVSYSISLSSANHGALANPSDPTSSVGYSLSSGAAQVSLNPGPGLIASGAAATFSNYARYSILVTISPFAGFPSAGSYSDTITVNLASP